LYRYALGAYHRLRQAVLEHDASKSGGAEVEEAVNRAAVKGYNYALEEAGPAAPLPGGDAEDGEESDDDDGGGGGGGAS
jgi:hypothetical protein